MDDGEAMVQCALLGLGLAQVPHYFVDTLLAGGDLVEVMPGLRPAPMPISVVYPAARLVPQRVRVLVDALVALRA